MPVRGGFFTDDQAAIVAGAPHDGFGYAGAPVTPGFRAIRQPAEALSVLLVLEDGSVEHGDCAAVQYSGVGGRDPVLDAAAARDAVLATVAGELRGRDVTSFRDVAEELAQLPVHTAVGYGVSQALLAVAARAQRRTMAEVVRDEWATGVELAAVPLYAQSGDDRHTGAEKMLLHGVDVLPHGLFNSVDLVGADGGRLADYLRWLVARAGELAPGATPKLHVDVYGTLGLAFGGDVAAVAGYLAALGEACAPFPLAVEHPMDGGSRAGQIELMAALRAELARLGSPVQVVGTSGATPTTTSGPSSPRVPPTSSRSRHPTWARWCTPSRRCWPCGPRVRRRSAAAAARRPTGRRRSPRTWRWPAVPRRCWPNRGWAWTRG